MKTEIHINILYALYLVTDLLDKIDISNITKHEFKLIAALRYLLYKALKTTNLTHIKIPKASYYFSILEKLYNKDPYMYKKEFMKGVLVYDSRDKRNKNRNAHMDSIQK